MRNKNIVATGLLVADGRKRASKLQRSREHFGGKSMIEQLRTPHDMNMEQMVSVLSADIAESIRRELDSMDSPFESHQVIEDKVKRALSPFLKAFTHCGKDPVCTEAVLGPTPPMNDHIYILVIPGDIEQLVDRIVSRLLYSSYLFLDDAAAGALRERIKSTLWKNLSSYIYSNPDCGFSEICKGSISISPWSRSSRSA